MLQVSFKCPIEEKKFAEHEEIRAVGIVLLLFDSQIPKNMVGFNKDNNQVHLRTLMEGFLIRYLLARP